MNVNREELLQSLESVASGLSPREILEQSSCFVFAEDGRVYTFNGETSCTAKHPLAGVVGAIKATTMLEMLRKLQDDELVVEHEDNYVLLKGRRDRFKLKKEKQILLQLDKVEKPKDWKKLHPDFIDAITLVKECAGKDATQFAKTCVHIHPKWIEACDGFQLARYKLRTDVSEASLVRNESIKPILNLGMVKYSETPTWMHFRNTSGLIFSCRRLPSDYPNLKPFLDVTGNKVELPKTLAEAAERAQVFSSENPAEDIVTVTLLSSGRFIVKGQSASGEYIGIRKTAGYTGDELSFNVSPTMLGELAKKYNQCEVTQTRLKVDGGKWTYIACLNAVNKHESNGKVHAEEKVNNKAAKTATSKRHEEEE